MDKVGGLSAFRWLFILEGIPSVIGAIIIYFFMPDYPETARWLSDDEKALAAARLCVDGSHAKNEGITWASAKQTLTDWRLYGHYVVCVVH